MSMNAQNDKFELIVTTEELAILVGGVAMVGLTNSLRADDGELTDEEMVQYEATNDMLSAFWQRLSDLLDLAEMDL